MSNLNQTPAREQLENIARPAKPQDETYFGSKLIQALAEYSGRFRSEFKLNESDAE